MSSTARADNVKRAINDIRNATDARRAGEIYATVARSAPNSAELRDVYMRKMLSLGRPDKAFGPAKALVKLDPFNGVAWAVVGCCSTSSCEGFCAMVRAAALLKKDAHVMGNLGQLVSWYDHQEEPPKIDPEVLALFNDHRKAWETDKAFAAGYQRREKGYAAHREAIADVEKAMERIGEDADGLEDELDRVEEEIAQCRARIRELEEEIESYWGIGPYGSRYGNSKAKAELTRQRTRLGELSGEKKELVNQGRKCTKKHKKLATTLLKVKRDEKGAMRDAGASFNLLAPASVPAIGGSAATPTTSSEKDDDSDSDAEAAEAEKAATKLLKRAKLYLGNNMADKARAILQEIVDEYDGTAAVAEAQELLKGL
jgi:TolA-binding protein